jgi:predicted transcriptional regulator of viral defense system
MAVRQAGIPAVVVLISAWLFHELGTQVPHEVWLQIPAKARARAISWPPVRFIRSRLMEAFTSGVQVHDLEGILVPVTTPARTVADCFKHRTQIGLEACLEALRDLLAKDRNVIPELTRHAQMNRVLRLMQPYMEAMA